MWESPGLVFSSLSCCCGVHSGTPGLECLFCIQCTVCSCRVFSLYHKCKVCANMRTPVSNYQKQSVNSLEGHLNYQREVCERININTYRNVITIRSAVKSTVKLKCYYFKRKTNIVIKLTAMTGRNHQVDYGSCRSIYCPGYRPYGGGH